MLSQERAFAHVVLPAVLACTALVACRHAQPDGRIGWSDEERSLESTCQDGDVTACRNLGERLVRDKRPDKDLQRGLVLLEIACGGDDWKACASLGDRYTDFSGPDGQEGKLGRAVELLGRACAHGIATACTQKGHAIAHNTPADRVAAKTALLAGCQLGDALGCEAFAAAQMRSPSGETTEVEDALSRGCRLSRLESCHALGSLLWRTPKRQVEATQLWRDACAKGLARSCDQLLASSAPLLSSSPDCGLLRDLAKKLCLAGDRNGCAVRSACQLRDGSNEVAAIVEELSAGCAAKHPLSCLYWADAREQSKGQSKNADTPRIHDAYGLACHARDLGNQKACVRLLVHDLNDSESSDRTEEVAYALSRYCSGGDAEACCQLGRAHELGKNVSKDLEKSERLRRKACDLGLVSCCPIAPESSRRIR
jgi:TPR repeat protein